MRTIWIMPGWVGIVMQPPRFADLASVVTTWWDRACQRRALADLSQAQLRDIGVTEEQRQMEIRKPFWL